MNQKQMLNWKENIFFYAYDITSSLNIKIVFYEY